VLLGHCHIGPPGYFREMWSECPERFGLPEQLRLYLEELGFDGAVVFAPFQEWMDGDPNAWLLKTVRGDARFVPWITLNGTGELALETLREHGPKGARGVKFHPAIIKVAINDKGLEPFYGLAERWRLPILYHTGPHGWEIARYQPLLVDQVAQRHPDLPLIIEHLGGRAFARETHAVMQNNPNVYGGLATCLNESDGWHVPADEIKVLIKRFGAARFCFGSDFPYNTVDQNRRAIAVLKSFKLPAADLGLILSGNLERLDAAVKVPGA